MFKIIYLITFPKFLSFVYVISKLSISSNYAKHFKNLALCYTLPPFIILKSSNVMGQLVYLKEDDFSFERKKLSHIKNLGL